MARTSRSEVEAPGRPPTARLFLALDLPPEARASVAAWRDSVAAGRPELRPVAEEALHVTLVFLGSRPEAEIEAEADAALGAVEGLPAPRLVPGRMVGVPKRGPRLFALNLDDVGGRAAAVHEAAAGALEAGGFYKREKRPFWPHVTLARVRRGGRPDPLVGGPTAAEFEAREVTLYRSRLSPRGARYEVLRRSLLT